MAIRGNLLSIPNMLLQRNVIEARSQTAQFTESQLDCLGIHPPKLQNRVDSWRARSSAYRARDRTHSSRVLNWPMQWWALTLSTLAGCWRRHSERGQPRRHGKGLWLRGSSRVIQRTHAGKDETPRPAKRSGSPTLRQRMCMRAKRYPRLTRSRLQMGAPSYP